MKPLPVPSSALSDYLKRRDASLHGKLAELRAIVQRWLTYVPATFGHYTSHTLDHSDEIVRQISWLLFPDGTSKPVIKLGAVEAYILIASSYLHDAGMVVPEAEKRSILMSDEWKAWTTEGSGAKRWKEIELLYRDAGADPSQRFAADHSTRLLIAEHVRRGHHRRAGELVRGRATQLARLDYEDPALRNAIAEVCVAHGLDRAELEDEYRFPEERQVFEETINLRLLAVLLRLGDLLDLRYDRACPLLLHAACPLPSDSIAHWSQYAAFEHRLTTPYRIEIRAQCRTQEEHRTIHDWCTWIVREVDSLPVLLPRATANWKPPVARMSGPSPSIVVEPAADATYVPGDWRFELDADAVFQRLVTDVYESPHVFLRELIQNALDAMRCRMYADLQAMNQAPPAFPNEAPASIRDRYVLRVSLGESKSINQASGEVEVTHIITVEDCGLGMDTDIVRRYLLQTGRSYYTTADFRHSFSFHPTSRFGVGFLSVFAASDDVTIETHKPSSKTEDGAIRLRLTGPRSYVLVEKGSRQNSGTRIDVRLRKPFTESLEQLVRQWCVFVEFPILVNDRGHQSVITAEHTAALAGEWPHPLQPSVRYARRVYPVGCAGIGGSFVVFSRIENQKERWLNPGAATMQAPSFGIPGGAGNLSDVIAFHGIDLRGSRHSMSIISARLDVRRQARIDMGRKYMAPQIHDPDVNARLEEIVRGHIGEDGGPWSADDWLYRAHLASDVRFHEFPMWRLRRDILPVWSGGHLRTCSVEQFLAARQWYRIQHFCAGSTIRIDEESTSRLLPEAAMMLGVLAPGPLESISNGEGLTDVWRSLYASSVLTGVCKVGDGLVATFSFDESRACRWVHASAGRKIAPLDVSDVTDTDMVGFGGANTGWVVVNTRTEFGEWYERMIAMCERGTSQEDIEYFARLSMFVWQATMFGSTGELVDHIRLWNHDHGEAKEFICPTDVLSFG